MAHVNAAGDAVHVLLLGLASESLMYACIGSLLKHSSHFKFASSLESLEQEA